MSLDLVVHNERLGSTLDFNWLRNPFGLERWADATYLHTTQASPRPGRTLWYVCNHWAYKKSPRVNRALFKQVVDDYAEIILSRDEGYFWFDGPGVLQFIVPNLDKLPRKPSDPILDQYIKHPRILGAINYMGTLGIPMQHFGGIEGFTADSCTLPSYQKWFKKLQAAAELLQEKDSTFYVSN